MGYLSRKPDTSNELPRPRDDDNPWLGESEEMDKLALFLTGMAKRCVQCGRATHIRYLDENQRCPDCYNKGE